MVFTGAALVVLRLYCLEISGIMKPKDKPPRRKPCPVFTRSYPNGVLVIEVRSTE